MGERTIKAAQLSRQPGGWRIEAAATMSRAGASSGLDAGDVGRLRDTLGRKGFEGNSIVLSVPSDELLTGILELPPRSSNAPIDQLARSELSRMHKCDGPGFEVACWDLPAPARAANSTFVMAVGCKHEAADRLLDLFEGEGLDVACLGTHATAAARACEPLLAGAEGDTAILDIGWTSAQLVLVHAGVIVYERKLHRGGVMALARLLGAQLDVSEDEAENLLWSVGLDAEAPVHDMPEQTRERILAAAAAHFQDTVKEMQIPFSYLANQYPDAGVRRILLVGGGAGVRGLRPFLASAAEQDVLPVAPTDLATCPESFDHEFGSSIVAAIGLARSMEG